MQPLTSSMALRPLSALLLALVSLHPGESTSLQSVPDSFEAGVTPNVTLRCSPGDTLSLLSNIAIFQMSKAGVLLATGRPTGTVLGDNVRQSKFSATSQMDPANLGNAFLLLTIQFPEADDEGEYKCDMNYEDKDGFFQHAEATYTLVQNSSDVTDVQRKLDRTVVLVNNLMTRVHNVEKQVYALVTDNSNQSMSIASLAQTVSNHVGFLATLSSTPTIVEGDLVVFDRLKFNAGGGFNTTSGSFVAPRAGYYALNLVCEVHADVPIRMEMELRVNGSTAMKLFISGEVTARGGQQSGSLVYDLQAGAEVSVVVGSIQTDPANSVVQLVSQDLTYFSGYLLG